MAQPSGIPAGDPALRRTWRAAGFVGLVLTPVVFLLGGGLSTGCIGTPYCGPNDIGSLFYWTSFVTYPVATIFVVAGLGRRGASVAALTGGLLGISAVLEFIGAMVAGVLTPTLASWIGALVVGAAFALVAVSSRPRRGEDTEGPPRRALVPRFRLWSGVVWFGLLFGVLGVATAQLYVLQTWGLIHQALPAAYVAPGFPWPLRIFSAAGLALTALRWMAPKERRHSVLRLAWVAGSACLVAVAGGALLSWELFGGTTYWSLDLTGLLGWWFLVASSSIAFALAVVDRRPSISAATARPPGPFREVGARSPDIPSV